MVERGVRGSVTATDPDAGDSVAFALNVGADEAKFAITPEGALSFRVAVSDGRGDSDEVTITVEASTLPAAQGNLTATARLP